MAKYVNATFDFQNVISSGVIFSFGCCTNLQVSLALCVERTYLVRKLICYVSLQTCNDVYLRPVLFTISVELKYK